LRLPFSQPGLEPCLPLTEGVCLQIRASVQPPDGPDQVSPFQPVGRARLAIQLLILAAILGSFVAAMVPLLSRAFLVGHDGFNGATFSMSAVNMLRFGLVATRAGPTRVYWERYPPKETRYYSSKPYGHPLLVTAAYALFGVSERVGRSVSLVFCLALIGLLFFFGLEVGAAAGGLVAAGSAASLPMMHQFGPMLTGQIPSLVFVLGFYCSYTWYLRTGALSSSLVAAFFVSLVGGGLLDWHIFVHLPVVVMHLAWTRRHEPKRVLKFFLLLVAIAAVPLLLFAAQTYLLDGFGYVLAKLRQRTGIAPAVAFTWGEFFFRQWHYLCAMYTRAVLLLALLALLLPAPGAAGELQRAARLAAVAALGETLLLNEAIYIHVYYTFIWLVPVSLALGSLVERFCQGASRLAVGMIAAILIGFLFTHSYQWVRAAVQASEKQM